MNQFFAGGFALIVAFLIWGLNKKPSKNFHLLLQKNFLQSETQESISLVNTYLPRQQTILDQSQEASWESPKTQKERIDLKKKIFKLITFGPDERLLAVQISSKLGDSNLLPILRRGLKDCDSRVVIAAAEGIQRHRKFSTISNSQSMEAPPRNIFLMR
tara:strand:+ start:860 stop:1336 length:477 start_codon:yes stop_codon:yes gene_type:complete